MNAQNERGGFERIRKSATGHPMWKLFLYCLTYWPRLGCGILSASVYRVMRLVPPVLVAVAIDRVIDAPGEPGLLADLGLINNEVIPAEALSLRYDLLTWLVVIAGVSYLIRAVARFSARYLIQSSAQKVQRDLRNQCYEHLQTLSMDFYNNNETGGMMSILNNDINQLEKFLNTELVQIIRVITIVVGIGGVMFYFYPKLAMIALVPVPFIALASGSFLIWIDKKYRDIRETVSRLNSRLANNLSGIKVIKGFTRHEFENERVRDQSQAYHDQHVNALRIRRAYFACLRLTTGIAFVSILYFGGVDVMQGEVSLGVFTLFFLFLRRLYGPMRRIGRTANKYQLAKSSSERVFGLLGVSPDITSPDDPVECVEIEGRVGFQNVRFGYPGKPEVLKDVNLSVAPGESIGLVGETGAGKSTLLKLIPRFFDADAGSVRVDGEDVRSYELSHLRTAVGIVDQDPFLFSGTVLENIAYGRAKLIHNVSESTDETITAMDEVKEAARAAEAHEFIARLPDGYATEIGERGVKLSGGQRQRISIARALLKDPSIIIFDEATSDVDTNTEILIQRSLNRLCQNRTAFLIAHRLSTVQEADRIVVMDDGRITEIGTHSELLSQDGQYSELWNAQAGEDAKPGLNAGLS